MKNTKHLIIITILLLSIFNSCDKVDKPFYIQEDCAGIIGGNSICGCTDPLAFNFDSTATYEDSTCVYDTNLVVYGCMDLLAFNYDSAANLDDGSCLYKKVLIEDFTGHRCPNCPSAAEELAALQNFYGDKVIGIAIHPSSQAFSTPSPLTSSSYTYDFRTEFGDDIDDVFELTTVGLPRGMVNRTGFDTEHQLGKDEWSSAVQTELAKSPIFGITLSSDVSNGDGTINVKVEALADLNNQYKIVICLTENGIIEWQKDNTLGDIDNYEHNHVLRVMLNTTFGESIGNSFVNGDIWEKDYSIDITSLEDANEIYSLNTLFMGNGNCKGWNENNMEIVAYIYNSNNYEIV
ncbi:MAG: Omp28-related outer membrane protein, partial [Flavobacteriales bacterium]|nr:Omp28-related outer membrane protein [Flavobacteriales bacterium]